LLSGAPVLWLFALPLLAASRRLATSVARLCISTTLLLTNCKFAAQARLTWLLSAPADPNRCERGYTGNTIGQVCCRNGAAQFSRSHHCGQCGLQQLHPELTAVAGHPSRNRLLGRRWSACALCLHCTLSYTSCACFMYSAGVHALPLSRCVLLAVLYLLPAGQRCV
jgi:hypothetical protein